MEIETTSASDPNSNMSFLSNSKKSNYTTLILFSETKWGKWNCQACSNSCGGGTHVCTRECENGEPGDSGCEGPSTKSFHCNEHSCPGKKKTYSNSK